MNRFAIERTADDRLRTRGLIDVGLHELSVRDTGGGRRDALCDLLRRVAAYQMSENHAFEAGDEIIDGVERLRTRRASDGTLEIVLPTSH